MNYDTFSEKISLWIDNELSPAEVAELETHLTTCAGCQQLHTQMRQIDQLFRTAALEMVAPVGDFTQRFEAQLGYHRPVKTWQLLLALGSLALGTLLFVTVILVSGLSLLNATFAINAGFLYEGVINLVDSADNLRALINLGVLFLKACLITMQQPVFWGFILLSIGLSLLWVRIMRALSRRGRFTTELIL